MIFAIGSLLILAGRDLSVFSAYTPNEPVVAFGVLDEPTATTITTADQYYPVAGTFNNTLLGWDYTPGCYVYDRNKPRSVFVAWSTALTADKSLTIVHIALRINGVVRETSRMGTKCQIVDDVYGITGMDYISLNQGDDVEMVITADGDGDVITVNHFVFFAVKIGD